MTKSLTIRTPAQRLKRRYNLCCRLRAKGVQITTDRHAIEVTEQQVQALGKTALRYCQELVGDYHYVMQLRIPDGSDGSGENPPLRPATAKISEAPVDSPPRPRGRPKS